MSSSQLLKRVTVLPYNTLPALAIVGSSVAIDTELTGMDKNRLHRPTGNIVCVTMSGKGWVTLFDDMSRVQEALDSIKDRIWIFHNAPFDLFHLRRWFSIDERSPDKLWDTMIFERLLWSGYYKSFGLGDLTRRYIKIVLDKKVRDQFVLKGTILTNEQRVYAMEDAVATFLCQEHQVEQILKQKDDSIYSLWNELEGPMIEIVQMFKGFSINEDEWNKMADINEQTKNDIAKELGFNPGSPKQVINALAQQKITMGSTQESELLAFSDVPIVKRILEYRKVSKLASTYGRKFLERFCEDGKIFSHYWTIGADSGRTASSNPNMQNIPSLASFRGCFVASPGNALGIYDYHQQEPCITAYESQDQGLLDAIKHNRDLHLETAIRIFNDKSITKEDYRRFLGKTLNLGITYGLGPSALRKAVNLYYKENNIDKVMSYKEALDLINAYFNTYPGIAEWVKHQHWLGENQGYVTTTMGRRRYLNPYSYNWKNVSVNDPIQGGAADQVKLAIVMFYNSCKASGIDFPIVAVVHDEIVIDVPENMIRSVGGILKYCMEAAGNKMFPGIKWVVSSPKDIKYTWAGKE